MVSAANGRALLYCAGGGLGDSLVASVVARALRSRFARVDALTLAGHRDLLVRVPDLDEVFVDDGGDERTLARSVNERGYAACVVTWATARTARVAREAKIPVRVGQARRLYSGLFTHRVTVRSETGDVVTPWSHVLLDYARAIGCDTGDATPRVVVTEDDVAQAHALLAAHGVNGAYAIVHATNSIAAKRPGWPLAGWKRLVSEARERYGVAVLVGGSAADTPLVAAIAAGASAVGIAGATSIGTFAALAQRAMFCAALSSGPMHVAAAVGAPTVGLFPMQNDVPDRWAPSGPRVRVVRASYPCPPGERKETCPTYACIEHLPVGRILAAIDSLIA